MPRDAELVMPQISRLPLEQRIIAHRSRTPTLAFNPLLILGLQLLWCILFFIFGRSMVTSAALSFTVRHDRI